MIEKIQDKIKRIKEIDSNRPRKKVAVLGAGMAGLTAALELSELGHNVVIYEANDRVGGRAWTHRFSDGEYHELGAMRFPAEHDHTRHYASRCGLTFRRFINHHDDEDTLYFFKGILSKHSDWDLKILPELNITDFEKWMINNGPIPKEAKSSQLLNLLVYPIETIKHEIESNPHDTNALLGTGQMTSRIKELDKISLGDFLRKYISSADALDLIGTVTGLEVWWDKAVTMFIRDEIAAEQRLKNQGVPKGIDEIEGGTDKLPNGLLNLLKNKGVTIQFKHSIFSINKKREQIQIGIKNQNDEFELLDYDFVICTLPFSILRRIKLTGLTKEKITAVRNLTYASSTKVLLNTKERFWETNYKIVGGASQLDLINRQVYYPSNLSEITTQTDNNSQFKSMIGQFNLVAKVEVDNKTMNKQSRPGVLVGSYCWGQDARRLGGLGKDERVRVVVEAISNIHPEILESGMVKDESASIFWDEYKFAGGAFCFMKPSDFSNYYSDTIKPEGNLFFAGEHCSLDQGWIQGAIISSLRAVEELVQK